MKLKQLEVSGFKSFADRLTFDFPDGITGIVGPNGCGKSNVVDAVKWVLGEQSAKSLRGGQMMDVIFNGSSARKSMGMAEVTLYFTGTRGVLNTELDEVSVTRRLYRSGESEYLINKATARLRDIRELFMDTGIGTDAYSIIEQGKVDVLLQSNPVERRVIFEEAAGISKYKAKKKEAMRKLERTEQNLLRVYDIIQEVEKQLRSIKIQATKARNYRQYQQQLKELRVLHSLAEYHVLSNSLQSENERLSGINDQFSQRQAELGRHELTRAQYDHELIDLDTQLKTADNRAVQLSAEITAQEDRIQMHGSRADELGQQLDKDRSAVADVDAKLAELDERLCREQQNADELEAHVQSDQNRMQSQQQHHQQVSLELTEQSAKLEDEKAGIIDLLRRTASLHNEINSLRIHRDNLTNQQQRLSDRDAVIRGELETLLAQQMQLQRRRDEIKQLIGDEQARLEEQRSKAAAIDQHRQQVTDELAAAKEYRSGLNSRQQLLADMEEQFEGVGAGVRTVLQARSSDPTAFPYVLGMVAQLLGAPVKHAAVIEAALAGVDQYLLASSSAAVESDVQRLNDLAGRVNVLCLDKIVPPPLDEYNWNGHSQVVGRAIDMVTVSEEVRPAAIYLLGRTVIVQTLNDAFDFAARSPKDYRFVSLDGTVVDNTGILRLGPLHQGSGLISRRSELAELDNELKEVAARIAQLEHNAANVSGEAEHVDKVQQDLRTAIYEANTARVETNAQLEQVDNKIEQLTREQPLVTSEVESISQQLRRSLQEHDVSKEHLAQLDADNQAGQQRVDGLNVQIDESRQMQQVLSEQLTEIKVTLGQLLEKRAACQESLNSHKRQKNEAEQQRNGRLADIEAAQQRIAESQQAVATARERIESLFSEKNQVEDATTTLRSRQAEVHRAAQQLDEQISTLGQLIQTDQEQQHQLQLKISELRVREEGLQQRVREELGLDLVEIYNGYEHTEQDWDAVAKQIDELRGKIDRLGNVNLDAITEQEQLEVRQKFLTEQFDDLGKSKQQLEELIRKINTESRDRFMATFVQVRDNFHNMFRKLFGGGKADIILEDPDDVLESGIEIIARPPGKELRSISLLSGGEKTMTAVALLMSIFKSKPSPFCILDEVDAALDEANNDRFNRVVKDFLNQSQFIIITHSKRTMVIADVLYGITMQERGISRKVAVRFEDHEIDELTKSETKRDEGAAVA